MTPQMAAAAWICALATSFVLASCDRAEPHPDAGSLEDVDNDVQQDADLTADADAATDDVEVDEDIRRTDAAPTDTAPTDTASDTSPADTDTESEDSGGETDAAADTTPDLEVDPDAGSSILGPLRPLTVTPHDEAMTDPERGWVQWINLLEDDVSTLRSHRNQGRTLAWAGVDLGEYRDAPLSDEFLASLRSGLLNLREAGLKIVLRFRYDETEEGIDAPLEQVLAHVAQLTPVLESHSEVIFVLEAGFVGAWGEWHSSSNGLDDEEPSRAIVEALLAALPSERAIALRTPMFKAALFDGPLAAVDAFGGSALARIGHHNDCFLASDSDYGTYADPVETWVSYVDAESDYVPVGGETCSPNPPRSECASALIELEQLGFSYLSSAWHPDVLDAWREGGCEAEIARRLGHRLQVTYAALNEWAAPGATAALEVTVRNVGFAPLRNPRGVAVWLFDERGPRVAVVEGLEPRSWTPGSDVRLEFEIDLPSTRATREYTVLLALPDASPILAGVPEFAVQFANTEMRPELGAIELGTILVGGEPASEGVEFAVRGRQRP